MVFLRVGVFNTGLPFVKELIVLFAPENFSEIPVSALIAANCHEMQLCLWACVAHTVTSSHTSDRR